MSGFIMSAQDDRGRGLRYPLSEALCRCRWVFVVVVVVYMVAHITYCVITADRRVGCWCLRSITW